MKKTVLGFLAFAAIAISSVTFFSCKDDDNDGDDTTPIVEPVENDEQAFALLNSAWRPYQTLSSTFTSLIDTPTDGFSSFLGKEDDDCTFAAQLLIEYTNLYPRKTFNALYKSIGIVNDAINKINESTGVTEAGSAKALAQAKFQRGLYYSYLGHL
jgi:hypothetical protein